MHLEKACSCLFGFNKAALNRLLASLPSKLIWQQIFALSIWRTNWSCRANSKWLLRTENFNFRKRTDIASLDTRTGLALKFADERKQTSAFDTTWTNTAANGLINGPEELETE